MDDGRAAMLRWLATDDAFAAARADLRRQGLDLYEPADLLHDVAVRLLRAELPDEVGNAAGYARRAIQLRVTDLLRGELVRDRYRVPDLGDDGEDLDLADPAASEPDEVVAAAALEDALRRSLFALLSTTRTWTVAAALTTLTLRVHPDVAIPSDAPQTDSWAALWLAGVDEAFPDEAAGRPDSPAVRKARSRALQQVDRLLRSVAEEVFGDP